MQDNGFVRFVYVEVTTMQEQNNHFGYEQTTKKKKNNDFNRNTYLVR